MQSGQFASSPKASRVGADIQRKKGFPRGPWNADIARQGPSSVHDPRLASVLQAAAGRIQAAIAAAVDKAAVQLAPLALSATSGTVRMELMNAERELRTKSGRILQGFQKHLQTQIEKSTATKATTATSGMGELDWDALSLVGADEVERGVMADRPGQTLLPPAEPPVRLQSLAGQPGRRRVSAGHHPDPDRPHRTPVGRRTQCRLRHSGAGD